MESQLPRRNGKSAPSNGKTGLPNGIERKANRKFHPWHDRKKDSHLFTGNCHWTDIGRKRKIKEESWPNTLEFFEERERLFPFKRERREG